jgi:hypothetical protein
MIYYKSKRPVDGKPSIWVVVDETGKIVNRSPNKDELKGLKRSPEKDGRSNSRRKYPYNPTNICDKCTEDNNVTDSSILRLGNAYREHNKDGIETGRWICHKCHEKYDPNSANSLMKSVRNVRTGNQDPNHTNVLGDNIQELACILYGWEDLNKKFDNYKFSLDCYDPKTELYHQVQGRMCSTEGWGFKGFEDEWNKKFMTMVCLCISEDGKKVERIYKFSWIEIMRITGVTIYKNPTNSHGNPKIPWYEEYRETDENELKRANKIWKDIIRG